MEDTKTLVKQYWPYIIGAIAGLYLILKFFPSSNSNSQATDYATLMAAQSQAAGQAAQIGLAQQSQSDQTALASKSLDVQSQATQIAGQASLAQSAAAGTSTILAALYAPAITAINASTAENAATVNAAAITAAAGFKSQSDIVVGTNNSLQAMAQAVNTWSGVASALPASQPHQSIGSQVAQVVNAASSVLLPASHWSNSQFGYMGV